MEFLGIGPLEVIAILLIIFVLMGPDDMVKMGSTLGKALRDWQQSDTWKAMRRASKELRSLPSTLARQANIDDLEDIKNEIKRELDGPREKIQELDRGFRAWTRGQDIEQEKPAPEVEEEEKDSENAKGEDS